MSNAPRPYIGGQAVIEGVMMRAPSCLSVAVRRPDGSIVVREGPLRAKLLNSRLGKLPGLRGMVMLVESVSLGYEALRFSAEQQMSDAERNQSRESGTAVWLPMVFALGLLCCCRRAWQPAWPGCSGRTGISPRPPSTR
jgi:uncharacterized protein YqhQ